MISGLVLSIFVAAGSAIAGGVLPTAPGPGQTFKEGGDCTLTWNLDTTGKWTSFSVDLMSGSNFAMSTVTNVFKDKDGTKGETSYTWKCPSVTPNSAIYFYQFSQANADTTWTTRFAISSPSGDLTAPANSTQPGGAQIPWGIGHLTSAGADPAPVTTVTTAPSATANTTALNTPATTTPATNPTNSTVASSTGNTTSTAAGTAGKTPSQTTSSSTKSNSKPSSSLSPTTSTPENNASTSTSGARAVTLCKNTASVLALVAVLIVI